MAKRKTEAPKDQEGGDILGLGGMLKGLGTLVEKLGELADAGVELKRSGELHGGESGKEVRGMYGFTVKVGLGGEGTKVEPFGNIRRDERSGRAVVQEVIEPAVDVFEEPEHTLVVAEMPGIGADDVQVSVEDDVLTISAASKTKKYRKEVLLPEAFPRDKMTVTCTNGVLEIRCVK